MSTSSARHYEVKVSATARGETRDLGTWDTWSGGGVTADNTKHRRGGMGPQVAIGGPKTVEDVTITRDYDPPRDSQHKHWLSQWVGIATIVASKTDLDRDGIAFGRPIVLHGVLVGYTHPEHDSDSGDVSMVGIVFSPDGEVG